MLKPRVFESFANASVTSKATVSLRSWPSSPRSRSAFELERADRLRRRRRRRTRSFLPAPGTGHRPACDRPRPRHAARSTCVEPAAFRPSRACAVAAADRGGTGASTTAVSCAERSTSVARASTSASSLGGTVACAAPAAAPRLRRRQRRVLKARRVMHQFGTANFTREQRGEDHHRRLRLGEAAGEDLAQRIGDEAEPDAGRDREGERHRDRRHHRRRIFGDVVPVEPGEPLRHHAGDIEQRRGGGVFRDHAGERREEQRQQEEHRHEHAGEPGAAAGFDAGRALDIARGVGGAEQRADRRGGRIRDQRAPHARQLALDRRGSRRGS